jgi:hypothetical protein
MRDPLYLRAMRLGTAAAGMPNLKCPAQRSFTPHNPLIPPVLHGSLIKAMTGSKAHIH